MKNFEPLSRRRFLCRALFVLTLLGTAARLPAAEPKAGAAKPAVEIRIVSYNILDDQYATVASQADAENRGIKQLGEEIKTRLAVYFRERMNLATGK